MSLLRLRCMYAAGGTNLSYYNIAIAEFPGALTKKLETRSIGKKPRNRAEAPVSAAIAEGQRNNRLFLKVCKMRNKGVEFSDALDKIAQINEASCDPPLDEDEVTNIVESAYSYLVAGSVPEYDYTSITPAEEIDLLRPALRANGYDFVSSHLVMLKDTDGEGDDEGHVKMSNVLPMIITQRRVVDVSGSVETQFEIRGFTVSQRFDPINVTAKDFAKMSWPMERWGAQAIIYAGNLMKDRLRVVVQQLAKDVPNKVIHTCTGIMKIDGKRHFLHANGAIPGGNLHSVELQMESGSRMDYYSLPTESDLERAKTAILLFKVATAEIAFTVFTTAIMAVARDLFIEAGILLDMIPALVGKTQSGKSSIAAIMLNLFGEKFNKASFPANFTDSAAVLEKKASMLSGVVIVVDDFKPVQAKQEAKEMNDKAQRLARMYGDGASRGRATGDMKIRTQFSPRGMALITGEYQPSISESGLARFVFVQVLKQDIDYFGVFAELERKKADLPYFTREYILWLIEGWDELREWLKIEYDIVKATFPNETSGRVTESIAKYALGFRLLLKFCIEAGFITEEEFTELERQSVVAFEKLRRKNLLELQSSDPTQMFIEIFRELTSSHTVHVYEYNEATWNGDAVIVYEDSQHYYVQPGLFYAKLQWHCQQHGIVFPLPSATLWKTLVSEGVAKAPSKTAKRDRYTFNRKPPCCGSKNVEVVIIPKMKIDPQEE